MAKAKKQTSIVDNEIEVFLKKNRVFSKTKKIDLSAIDSLSQYVYGIIDEVLSTQSIKYLIIQLGIQEDKIERFLYTEDTYVFIFTDLEKYENVKQLDYSKYSDLIILFYENGTLLQYGN